MVSAMLFKYNLFLSYASENKDIADYIVDRIENVDTSVLSLLETSEPGQSTQLK